MTERPVTALAHRFGIECEVGRRGVATVYLAEIWPTANLQHPHVLPLFDSGQAGG